MSDLPAFSSTDRHASPPRRPAPMREALGASAVERLAPVRGALMILWGLVFWALR
ncbi:MAG: hypothetical protein WAK01_17805 [Methylocystis sp.]